jgi:hypothetical protein
MWTNNDTNTLATEPKRGGSGGGPVFIGLIVGVADDSIATAGGNRGILVLKKRQGTSAGGGSIHNRVHVRGRVIRSAANVGTTRLPLATVKRELHVEYKRGKSTNRPEIFLRIRAA